MQFRAAVLYIALFSLIAVGAYAMHTAADAPEATIDESEADHALSQGENLSVGDRTYNLTDVSEDGSGVLEYVNESGIVEAEWEDGDTVPVEENGTEYAVVINSPEEEASDEGDGGNESGDEGNESDGGEGEDGESGEGEGNESDGGEGDDSPSPTVTLREDFDEEDFDEETYRFFEIDGELHVGITENGTERVVHIDDFEEVESQTYESGDEITFYHGDSEQTVDATITEVTEETVSLEWRGETRTEYELENGGTITLNDQEYVAYFPSAEEVYLSSDVDSFEEQEEEVEAFQERLTGLWWVITMAVITIILLAGMAFMPVRG